MIKIPEQLQDVLYSDPEYVSGAVCFVNTRVPVRIFLDTIASGASVDRFLQSYSGVTREQAMKVLAWQNEHAQKTIGLDRAS